jgi:5'-3' exonuclease
MIVHVVDGTYELFRHFYGLRRFNKGKDNPYAAVIGVLQTMLQMLEKGATHVAVATDHVIESFRNDLWPDYKTSEGIEPELLAQFPLLEEALAAAGVGLADDRARGGRRARLGGATIASGSRRVEKVCIWTVDKDLAQCVREDRVVQMDRRANKMLDAAAVRQKYGVPPALIPDFLALVGDAADGYPGIAGIGAVTAARLLNRHGPIESFPADVLGGQREQALLFKQLATLRTDAPCSATSMNCAGAVRPTLRRVGAAHRGARLLDARKRRRARWMTADSLDSTGFGACCLARCNNL